MVKGSGAELILTSILMQGCPEHGDQCASLGGSIYASDGTNLVLVESTITGSGGYHGGALFVSGSNTFVEISDSTFLANTASARNVNGGCVSIGSGTEANIARTTFLNCTTSGSGGAISLSGAGAVVTVERSTFDGSSASIGAAIGQPGPQQTISEKWSFVRF